MGIGEILTIIFVLLKVFDVVEWSWWIVFLPEIIALVIYAILFIAYLFSAFSLNKRVDKEFRDFDKHFKL